MWNYNKQILIRWISFVLAFMMLGLAYSYLETLYPGGISRMDLKALIARVSVSSEFLPVYFWPLIFLGLVLLFLLGVPTIIVFCPIYIVKGPILASLTVLIGQTLASIIAVYLARRKDYTAKIPVHVLKSIVSSGTTPSKIAFWGRLYLSYPLRTLDLAAASLLADEDEAHKIYPAMFIGFMVRSVLPIFWAISLIRMGSDIAINTAQSSTEFLIWSVLLICQIILPKIPELMVCNPKLKSVFRQIESWDVPLTSPKKTDKGKRPKNKIQLGMQP